MSWSISRSLRHLEIDGIIARKHDFITNNERQRTGAASDYFIYLIILAASDVGCFSFSEPVLCPLRSWGFAPFETGVFGSFETGAFGTFETGVLALAELMELKLCSFFPFSLFQQYFHP